VAGAILAFVYPLFTDEERGGMVDSPALERPAAERLGEETPTLAGEELALKSETAKAGTLETSRQGASGQPGWAQENRDEHAPDAPESRAAEALPEVPEPSEQPEASEARGSLLFTLEDVLGDPLPGVRVSLRSERVSAEAETEGRGRALFAGLFEGSYSYLVHAPDGRMLKSAAPIELREAEERVITLRLGDGGLSISGRVLNQDGEPVPDLAIFAVPYLLTETAERLVSPGQREGQTREDGSYAIRGLEPGEYEVRTAGTELYPSARVVVPAGVTSADLVLLGGPRVRVYGTVTNTRGEPLVGVRVVRLAAPVEQTRTDDDGNYEIYLIAEENRNDDLSFTLGGYHAERPRLMGRALVRVRERRLDVQLEAVLARIVVSGTLRTERGDPVAGERVHLVSSLLKTGYAGVSDLQGDFRIPGVEIGYDYQLWIQPRGKYQDFTQRALVLDRDGLFFDILLESLTGRRLTGRIIDSEGTPLPGFHLWLWSERALGRLLPVSSDGSGNFIVEEAPEGPVKFGTRSRPHLRVSGISLPVEDEQPILLVVDWGNHVVSGNVWDGGGSPVAGAQVQLSWWHQTVGTRSTSNRNTLTDKSGSFRFTQIGPGPHQLKVTASGYHSVQQRHEVGMHSPRVEVRLEPLAQ
jgi:protocatechuate 3,4-dioxygenase beta subunit